MKEVKFEVLQLDTYGAINITKLSKCKVYKHDKYLLLVGVRGKFIFLHDIRSVCT